VKISQRYLIYETKKGLIAFENKLFMRMKHFLKNGKFTCFDQISILSEFTSTGVLPATMEIFKIRKALKY